MTVGNAVRKRIIDLCRIKGISITRLGALSGVTPSTINNIVSGRNKSTTVSTVKKLCDGLNISFVQFFDCPLFLDENLDSELE